MKKSDIGMSMVKYENMEARSGVDVQITRLTCV